MGNRESVGGTMSAGNQFTVTTMLGMKAVPWAIHGIGAGSKVSQERAGSVLVRDGELP